MKIENSSVSSFVDFYSEISAAIIQVEALKKKVFIYVFIRAS